MEYSSFDYDYREYLAHEVNAICTSYDVSSYGSFSTGNFHLSSDRLSSFSDVDLIYNGKVDENFKKEIANELHQRTSLELKISIRQNNKHVFYLPKKVSRQLALVDTLVTLCYESYLSDENFSYLVSKYILRTVYADIYFENKLTDYLSLTRKIRNDPLLASVSRCKLHGGKLLDMNLLSINGNDYTHASEVLNGLKSLCRINTTDDLHESCKAFFDLTMKHGLSDLSEDLSKKISSVNNNPNKSFNSDCQTRRSLSLALGLAAG